MALLSLRDGEHFRVLADKEGRPFRTFEDFVRAREPFGLAIFREKDGTKTLDKLMEEVAPLAKHGTNQHRSGAGDAASASPLPRRKLGSNNAAYLLARIQRDAPEIAARIGEFTSARAAAIAAGIPVGGKTSAGSPEDEAKRVLAKGDDHARAVRDAIAAELERRKR